MSVLVGTPFHSRTSELCASHAWERWSGYLSAASYYLNHEWEYHAIRSAAALIDVSPLQKYRFTGPEAGRLLNRIVTRDISRCAVGQVFYTPWCDDKGKVIDDGTLHRLAEQEFLLTAAEPNLFWFHECAYGMDVRIQDESNRIAALSLQGPLSREILKHVTPPNADLEHLPYFWFRQTRIGDYPVNISRTGYTGDLGYEIWLSPEHAVGVWDSLMQAGVAYSLTPVGNHAMGLARIEAGLILIHVDYISSLHALIDSQKSSPFELGLGWTINFNKGNFVGRDALLAEKQLPPVWRFVGLEIDWPSFEELYHEVGLAPHVPAVAERASVPLYDSGRQVGYATSRCYSPTLKKYIALATIEASYNRPGTNIKIEMTVEHKRHQVSARVVQTPFFDPERKRN